MADDHDAFLERALSGSPGLVLHGVLFLLILKNCAQESHLKNKTSQQRVRVEVEDKPALISIQSP